MNCKVRGGGGNEERGFCEIFRDYTLLYFKKKWKTCRKCGGKTLKGTHTEEVEQSVYGGGSTNERDLPGASYI